jgi:PBP1b-binding outer membrane lipoprotein LpoB
MRVASLVFLLLCLLLACGPFRRDHRVETKEGAGPEAAGEAKTTVQPDTEWSKTKVDRLAKNLMDECLSWAWTSAYVGVAGEKPLVTVGPIHNRTGEKIDPGILANALEHELSKSGQVIFVASKRKWDEPVGQSLDQEESVSRGTLTELNEETGADFVLAGSVSLANRETESGSSGRYRVDLEMINVKTMARVWEDSELIEKVRSGR